MIKQFLKWKLWLVYTLLLTSAGCAKFLEEKADKSMVVPGTLSDLDALLWSSSQININFPGLLEMGTDDFYVKSEMFSALDAFGQQVYRWDKEINFDVPNTNIYWTNAYATVLTANTVLDKLKNYRESDPVFADKLEGEALFIRSLAFYYLVEVYAPAYVPGGDNDDLGIPLKLSSDIHEPIRRATVKESYAKIVDDLLRAKSKLGAVVEFKTRASRPAASALLARIFLIMGDYDRALETAKEALSDYSNLMDYNDLDPSLATPFVPFNDDVIFFAYTASAPMIASYMANVDSTLYRMYGENDLRKELFFEGSTDNSITFKGWYSAINSGAFMGMNTPEVHLLMAECYARKQMFDLARNSLKILLSKRYLGGQTDFIDIITDNEILSYILIERRKELLFRGVRWSDLKRLNREEAFRTTIVRKIQFNNIEQVFELHPNDSKYVYPIPQTVVDLGVIPQNRR